MESILKYRTLIEILIKINESGKEPNKYTMIVLGFVYDQLG
jgi:hypothetical protein